MIYKIRNSCAFARHEHEDGELAFRMYFAGIRKDRICRCDNGIDKYLDMP